MTADMQDKASVTDNAMLRQLEDILERTIALDVATMSPAMRDRYRAALSVEKAPAVETPPPVQHLVPCPCTLIEQDEDCPVGYPSLLCGVCEGKGHTTQEQVTALACEMIEIASDMGEPDDPFAAWESIEHLKSELSRLQKEIETAREGAKNAVRTAYERRLKKHRSGCSCHFGEDDETLVRVCEAHRYIVETAREALEPFAVYADSDGFGLDSRGGLLPDEDSPGWVYVTNGDFRRAAAAYRALKNKEVAG